VVGACALAVWGQPRATLDLDLLVLVDEHGLARVVRHLQQAGMALDAAWSEWNPLLRALQARLRFRDLTVDILRPRDRHDVTALSRRRRRSLAGHQFWFVAAEDLILQKLKVGRPRDFEDALSVLVRQGRRLDRRHLRRWAARLGIEAELAYVERGLQA
jgi:hypothetical protein